MKIALYFFGGFVFALSVFATLGGPIIQWGGLEIGFMGICTAAVIGAIQNSKR